MTALSILAPLSGEVIPVTAVPDPVFSQKMLGQGMAIRPLVQVQSVLSPVSGKIIKLFKTGHAFALVGEANSLEVLVHVGLDTVGLKGVGFQQLLREGDEVRAGQPVVKVDIPRLVALKKDPITPVVFIGRNQVAAVDFTPGTVQAGTPLCQITLQANR
ncbi:PTS sugar transporter subunit IIA [Varibaculum vaginae]|uniref:PTS sugar transporter subunit IIA n=1 Tax=Varibaculum vaginae TaxID=2364797 RepID=UPI000F098256|nr:PTS glucose transporter subunit IIA [Varibaculum vaginae]